MYSDEQMKQEAETFLRLKSRKKDLEDRLLASERILRAGLKDRKRKILVFGDCLVDGVGPNIRVFKVEDMDKRRLNDRIPF